MMEHSSSEDEDITMSSNEITFTTRTEDVPPQDRTRASRRTTSILSINSESLGDLDPSDRTCTTGESLNLSGLGSLNYDNNDDEHHYSASYESPEDEKARILAHLMQNHLEAVTASLVERTMLIQSVIWLSHHVPGCVVELLLEDVVCNRQKLKGRQSELHDYKVDGTGNSEIVRAMKDLTRNETTSPAITDRSPDISGADQKTTSIKAAGDSSANIADSEIVMAMRDLTTNETASPATADCSPGINGEDEKITSILEADEAAGDADQHSYVPLNDTNTAPIHTYQAAKEEKLPISKKHDSALLFVDMSGFTKISTILDVESLSNAINSYFQLIVNEVTHHGGDILKFAGDAIFAEWKSELNQTIEYCVMQAANCAASIVANCSDYPIHSTPVGMSRASMRLENTRQSSNRGLRTSLVSSSQSSVRNLRGSIQSADEYQYAIRNSVDSCCSTDETLPRRASTGEAPGRRRSSVGTGPRPVKLATLNVKCGIGVGRIVGVHVGDDASRREYLILGDPIDQVAAAEGEATNGQVFASPEAVAVLSKIATLNKSCGEDNIHQKPVCIAVRQQQFFQATGRESPEEGPVAKTEPESLLNRCEALDMSELRLLKRMIALYAHPVVVNDENESQNQVTLRRASDTDRHLSEAELRNVFVAFISPQIEYKLTGDEEQDGKLINLLNDIMNLTTRNLNRAGGHLRQFIVDDKGVVLICTFGLRGSTFPNMISQRALPLTRSIYESLQEELGVKCKIGGTYGRAYCGVVGGLSRHEFAVLGPSVNLSARLMAFKFNPGILVDKNVRLLTSHSQIFFKPLPPVTAKGYDEPVPIFEPLKSNESQFGKLKPNFIGRSKEIKQVMNIAKGLALHSDASKFVFVSAASGSGKSSMIVQTTARVRAMIKKMNKSIVVTRHVSNEGDSRVPFSLFRSVFKDLLNELRHEEDTRSHASNRGESTFELSVEDVWDNLSLASQSSKDSMMSTDANRFRYLCDELNAPPDFAEVVGRRLLGIRDKSLGSSTTTGTPNLDLILIVEFLVNAFIRCTGHSDLVLLSLDDVQDLDEMSFKVVQGIFERGQNVLILSGSRPLSSYQLAVDSSFWAELQGSFLQMKRFVEIDLQPLTHCEVRNFIAISLDVAPSEINDRFSQSIFTVTGGMPHFLSYAVENIKRLELFTRMENGLVGLKSAASDDEKLEFGSVSELLLYRLDSLDSSVRNALHFAAVLGTEFELVDAALAYDEMYNIMDGERSKAALALQEALHVAVEEGIIEESFAASGNNDEEEFDDTINEAQASLCASLGNITFSLKGYRRSHPAYSENRRYRFTHDSWKTSILDVMLDERVQEIHEHVAIILEREIDLEDQTGNDFDKQIRVFYHWNKSGHFMNASQLALKIGEQLMVLGLNSQAILLFDDVLNTLKDSSDNEEEMHGGISTSVLNAIKASELEDLIKLNIAKGKAYSTLGNREKGAEALQGALDILHNAPCANSTYFDRSVSFPIFSGLFVVLKMGAIKDDENCSYEKDLTKKFVEQARLNNDPIHYGRALAMEGETLGRLGMFDQALEALERIKPIYDIETQHTAISKAYGSDRVAQSYSHSVNWNTMLGRTDEAVKTCKYIIGELAPKSNPQNVHNSFCLLYSVIIALKENGAALEARDALKRFVVEPFDEHFGPGGTTFSKPLFYPLLMLLDLQGHQDEHVEKLCEYLDWSLEEANFSVCSPSLENAWAAMAVSPNTFLGEICYYLAKRTECPEHKDLLIKYGIGLIEKSIEVTRTLPFANMYAIKKLNMLKSYAGDSHESSSIS